MKLKKLIKFLLRLELLIPVISFFSSLFVKTLPYKGARLHSLLVLNHIRYMNDLETLNDFTNIKFKILPERIQAIINAICLEDKFTRNEFLKNKNKLVIKNRKRLYIFLRKYLYWLNIFTKFDGILTCSFYYAQDQEWDRASHDIKISSFVLYKENLKYETKERGDFYTNFYHSWHYKFNGTKTFVFDNNSMQTLIKSNVLNQDKISVIGMPRMDRIFKRKKELLNFNHKSVVLFSFRHNLGGHLTSQSASGTPFSKDRTFGVCNLFDQTHGCIAELAINHPKIQFYIKTKWEHEWVQFIKEAIKNEMSVNVTDIQNLTIVSEKDTTAHELIEKASVVIGFNSTTVLESILFGKYTIVPFFEEAKNKYADLVHFKDYFDEMVIAHSKHDLKDLILKGCKSSELSHTGNTEKLVKKYVGFFDGKNSKRFESEVFKSIPN